MEPPRKWLCQAVSVGTQEVGTVEAYELSECRVQSRGFSGCESLEFCGQGFPNSHPETDPESFLTLCWAFYSQRSLYPAGKGAEAIPPRGWYTTQRLFPAAETVGGSPSVDMNVLSGSEKLVPWRSHLKSHMRSWNLLLWNKMERTCWLIMSMPTSHSLCQGLTGNLLIFILHQKTNEWFSHFTSSHLTCVCSLLQTN